MKRIQFRQVAMIIALALAFWPPGAACLAMTLTEYAATTQDSRLVSENLPFNAQGQVLDQWTENSLKALMDLLQKEENRYYQLYIIGFDNCSDAAGLNVEILRRLGSSNLFITPKVDCITPAPAEKAGRIEVWLVPVDDGA